MRIITGSAGGLHLLVPKSLTRPSAQRTREAVFSILASQMDFSGLHVLDLFAGTGALGIECLSRGAARAEFVDSNREASACIEKNLAKARFSSAVNSVHCRDAFKWLEQRTNQKFDLIFADPPYLKSVNDIDFAAQLLDNSQLDVLATTSALFVLETSRDWIQTTSLKSAWTKVDHRIYGGTATHFFQKPEAQQTK